MATMKNKSKNLPKLMKAVSDKITGVPVLMDEKKLEALVAALSGLDGSFFDFEFNEEEDNIKDSIAVIPVMGPLMHHESFMSWMYDASTYDTIRKQFDAAIDDEGVKAIVLHVDSPGGEASGAFDLSDHIYEARGKKSIVAVANDDALSGGYLLASAADKLYITRTSNVGSVGVVAKHVDYSEADKKAGIKVTTIKAGEKKALLNPDEPLSKEGRDFIQKQVDGIYDMFVSTVARNKSLTEQAVRDTQAGIYSRQEAVDIGFADGIKTFDEVLEAVAGELAAIVPNDDNQGGKKTMDLKELKEKHPELYQQVKAEGATEARASIVIPPDVSAKVDGLVEKLTAQETKIAEQDRLIAEQDAKIKAAEKAEMIRREKDIKAEAEAIFNSAISACEEIPARLHPKIKSQVDYNKFVGENGVFDSAGFKTRVDAEVAEWKELGKGSSVDGFGTTSRVDGGITTEEKPDIDNMIRMLELSGDQAAADRLRKEKGGN